MLKRAVLLVSVVAAGFSVGETSLATDGDETGVIATFENELINLANGWGDAGACVVDDRGARCYRTQAELESSEANRGIVKSALMATCATSLTLYSGANQTGSALSLSARGTSINLSSYGFNNITSSYSIGACAARLYNGSAGSGLYPGNTSAGAGASSMLFGWDNTISTVYIL